VPVGLRRPGASSRLRRSPDADADSDLLPFIFLGDARWGLASLASLPTFRAALVFFFASLPRTLPPTLPPSLSWLRPHQTRVYFAISHSTLVHTNPAMTEQTPHDVAQLADQLAQGFAALSDEYQVLFDRQRQLESKLSWAKQQVCPGRLFFLHNTPSL
jgi:hypothetical protein